MRFKDPERKLKRAQSRVEERLEALKKRPKSKRLKTSLEKARINLAKISPTTKSGRNLAEE